MAADKNTGFVWSDEIVTFHPNAPLIISSCSATVSWPPAGELEPRTVYLDEPAPYVPAWSHQMVHE